MEILKKLNNFYTYFYKLHSLAIWLYTEWANKNCTIALLR